MTNRDREAERFFRRKDDYKVFIKILKEASETCNLHISAYCLMPNNKNKERFTLEQKNDKIF